MSKEEWNSDEYKGDKRFEGRRIVITGAGGNFGREGCIYFALKGARVVAMDNNTQNLEETQRLVWKELQRSGLNAPKSRDDVIVGLVCDVTDVDSVERAMTAAVDRFGGIELLWNNAGYQGQIKPLLEYSPQDFAAVMNVNVTGMFIVLQSAARRMASAYRGEGHPFAIVNTASVAGLRGTPAMIAYSSSKAAVLAMTVAAAKDLAPHGIRVNAVSPALIGPGYMWTRQNELHAASGSPYFATDPDVVAQEKINSVPMKRLGSIQEVIKSVAFLLSDDSSYTTATNLVVDGGMSGGLRA